MLLLVIGESVRKLFLLFLIAVCSTAHATTWNVTPASNLQSVITGASAGDTIQFAAGTYTISSGLTLKGGITYTGTVVTHDGFNMATPTAILNGTCGTGCHIFNFFSQNSATPGVIQYLAFNTSQGIYAQSSSNFTIQFNSFGSVPYQAGQFTGAIYLDGTSQATPNANLTIQWNKIGDSNSCAGEEQVPNSGGCNGIEIFASLSNVAVVHNNFFHVSEGVHVNCPDYGNQGGLACEPPGGAITRNVTAQYNDFSNIHRIPWEEQPQESSGINFSFNDNHDWLDADFGSYGVSFACCANGQHLTPFIMVTSNLIMFNQPIKPGQSGCCVRYGYGMENMGYSSTYANNMVESAIWPQPYVDGVVWGNGGTPTPPNSAFNWTNNYICGTWTGYPNSLSEYIKQEGNGFGQNYVPISTGSNLQPNCGVTKSQIPTISPTPTGTYSSPIAVTITDNGYTSGAQALGNTSIYYTTDGSTPTTASTFCNSPCAITVSPGTVVNAVGMWGSQNQPRSYAAGFGFVPSSVASAHYTTGSTPTLTGVTLSLPAGVTSVQVGKSIQVCANMTYTGVSPTQVCGSGADQYGTTPNTWGSSNTTDATISSSGSVTGLAAGSTNLTVHAGSFTSPSVALGITAAAPTLVGASLSCPTPISVGQTGNCTMTCSYTGPQQLNCTTVPDQNGNVASGWTSSAPSIATVSSNVVSAVAAGNTNISATVGSFTPSSGVQITGSTPPVATLVSVSVSCSPGAVSVGSTTSCKALCAYSDASTADCTVTDAHGSLAGSWTSSVTADATINSTTGVVTGVAAGSTNIQTTAVNGMISVMSPAIALPVVAVPTSSVLGNNQFNMVGFTSANYINATYAVTGTSPAIVSNCNFYLPTGTTYAAGSKWDCGLILAPTPTTQASSWLCHATYTTLGTSADVGFHSLAISGCGTLPASTGYWIAVDTNETSPSQPGQGFWNCGSSCTGSAPTLNNGTYACRYISATYGVYTGMQTTMAGICGSVSPQVQASQYVTVQTPTPTFVSAGVSPGGFANTLIVGGSFQFFAFCNYSDGSSYQCFPGSSPYGDTATAWSTSDATVMTIGAIGSTHPGLATGIKPGFANAQATITGGHGSTQWGVTINAAPTGSSPTSSRVFSR